MIVDERLVRILPACPQCGGRYGQPVTVLANSCRCTGCGAWLLLEPPPPDPVPHHNWD